MPTARVFLVLSSLPFGAHGCTLIAAAPGASVDGSALVGSTNDCQDCDSRMAHVAACDWPEGTVRPLYRSDDTYPREVATGRSSVYEPVTQPCKACENSPGEPTKPIGYIPEVAHTYAYWEALYGFMNEHGLGLAESSVPSKWVNLKENGALLSIRELTRLAMERCKTSRCAVQTVGALAEKYGFYGEDPDLSGAGDTLALADGKETWIFHVSGDPTGRSAFWVAQRLPEGHVCVIANTYIIREVDCANNLDFYCATDLEAKVKATGEWNGEGHLDWAAVIPPNLQTHSYVVNGYDAGPIPYYVTARTWRVLSKLAPSLGLKLTRNVFDYPFSVRPDEKLTHRRFMDLWRDNFEGTEIDLTGGALAGPFGSPYRQDAGVGLGLVRGQFARSLSLPRTNGYFVSQTFGEGGINKLWVGQDTPTSTVLVPFYAKTMQCDVSYNIGNMSMYDDRSAWWVFDFVANWMSVNHRLMRVDVEAKIQELQDHIDHKNSEAERAAKVKLGNGDSEGATELLNQHQADIQKHTVDTWRSFGHFLIMKYNDGYVNDATFGTPIGYPAWWLQQFGVNDEIKPKWGQPSLHPPSYYQELGPGPYEQIPKDFVPDDDQSLSVLATVTSSNPTWGLLLASVTMSLLLGFILGQRKDANVQDEYRSMADGSC